uniref:Uncharacterized protein n=1 Tax=Arundo donax TaxID=35708 RepID=A0A0A9GW97_ARUDO
MKFRMKQKKLLVCCNKLIVIIITFKLQHLTIN